MTVLFFCILIAMTALYFLSKGRYEDVMKNVDGSEFRLKEIIPTQMYLLELCRYDYKARHNRKLMNKLVDLYGIKNAFFYLKVHVANKLAIMTVAVLILTFFGMFTPPDAGYAMFFLAVIISVYFYCDYQISKKLKQRKQDLQRDFPEFLNKLTLLINAGINLTRAIEKIVADNDSDRIIYIELASTISEIRSGKSEIKAYEDFAKRCKVGEITKFVSVIVQNLKKGNMEMVTLLRLLADECWENRKNSARKLGEEASTKLLLPMMIIFIAILIIVITPAIISLQDM